MAWMFWLLAPMASTVLGGALIYWRARREIGGPGRRVDAMREHDALLGALPQPGADDPMPVTMRLLTPESTTS